jgi:IPT/TIG domain
MFRTLLLSTLLAAPLAAQTIVSVNGIPVPFEDPADIIEASVGTQIVIAGTGFAGLTGQSKPKVFMDSAAFPKNRPMKVVNFTDTELVCEVKSGVVGDFDVTIVAKGPDFPPLVAEGVLRIVPPVFEQPTPGVSVPGGLVTLHPFWDAQGFGTKKGKVKVGGKKAVVQSWTPGEIVFLMPSKLPDGIHIVTVKNKVATATVEVGVETAPYCLQMDGSLFDLGGPDRFSCKVGKKAYKADNEFLGIVASAPEGEPVMITARLTTGMPQRSMVLVVPVDLATDTFPLILHGSADGKVELTEYDEFLDFSPDTWTTDFDGEGENDWIMVLQSYEFNEETGGPQLVGAFSGHIVLVSSDEATPTEYDVSLGDFRVTVEPTP